MTRNGHSSGFRNGSRLSNGLPKPLAIDRLPPHSIEAEQATIGALLLDSTVAMPEVVPLLGDDPECFFDLRHAVIYQKICELAGKGWPANVVTVGQALADANQLEACGGYTYLSALPDVAPTAAMAGVFARTVADKAEVRRLLRACASITSSVFDGGNDAEQLMAEAEKLVMSVRRSPTGQEQSAPELVKQALDDIELMHQNQGKIQGLSTGLLDLDKVTDGLHADELVVLCGAAGGGKTSLAMNIVEHVAVEEGLAVGVFSFEMSPRRLMRRMLASRARVNLRNIKDGYLTEGDFARMKGASIKLRRAALHVVNASGMTIFQLRGKARQLQQQHGVRLWVVDYLQIVEESGRSDRNREREVAHISKNLKQMASEFGAPVLAISQLNKDGQTRESAAIEHDADAVWKVESEGEPDEKSAHCQPVKIVITKQRDGESPAIVHATFFKSFVRFELAAKITKEDEP